MTLHTDQMSDSFRIGAILAAVGGFLDAYTYLARGQVFANAQTGNIVLLGVHLSEGDFKKALSYLVPILAFVAGVFVDEWIKHRLEGKLALHWRQTVLLIEILALVVVIFLPLGKLTPLPTHWFPLSVPCRYRVSVNSMACPMPPPCVPVICAAEQTIW